MNYFQLICLLATICVCRSEVEFDMDTLDYLSRLNPNDIPANLKSNFSILRSGRVEKDGSNWCCNNKHNFEHGPVPTMQRTRISWKDVINTKSFAEKFYISCALGTKRCERYRVAYHNAVVTTSYIEHYEVPNKAECANEPVCCNKYINIAGDCLDQDWIVQNWHIVQILINNKPGVGK